MSAMAHYIYTHKRLDDGRVFYVGKGSGRRAWVTQHRNPYWKAVVAKAGGYTVDIAIDNLDEELSLLAEVELIHKLKTIGARLTNLTDGGEGMSGFTIPSESIERRAAKMRGVKRPDISERMRGVPKTEQCKAKLSASRTGTKASDEARRKMSETRKGRVSSMLGKKHREESKQKISDAIRGEKNPFYGKKHDAAVVERIRLQNLGRKDSEETRRKKSEARKGEKNPLFGVPVTPERKAKQLASLMATLAAKPKLTCIHCGKVADQVNAKRWHFDNCKHKVI
jgi:hypothetical protein